MNNSAKALQTAPEKSILNAGFTAVVMCLIMIFIMGLEKIYSPDLGFHLKSAEWMLENKQFIHTDSFSYGSAAHKYFDLQWLYQLLAYTLYKKGESVLIIANDLFIVISFLLVWFRGLKHSSIDNSNVRIGLFAFVLVVFAQPLSFEIRPQVVSWIFLNLVLLLLELYKKDKRKVLFFLPLIMLVWANMHSIAILGLVTIGIYSIGSYIENKMVDKTLFVYSLLSFIAFIVTPYFFEGLIYSLSQFGIISGNSLFKSYLGELQSPFSTKEITMLGSRYFTNPLLIVHLSALLSLFSIWRAVRKKQFTDAMLLSSFLVLLYLAHRNYGVFIFVSLPLFLKYLLGWLNEKKKKDINGKKPAASVHKAIKYSDTFPHHSKLYQRFAVAAIAIAIFISITCVSDGYRIFIHSPNRFGLNLDRDQLPVDATAYLTSHQLKGKLLNHLDFGGYLMSQYSEKVFIDGRMDLFEEDFFKKYYESLTVRNGFKKLLQEYQPDIVIFPYVKASSWWSYFILNKQQSGYKPVYFDGLAVIYVKASAFPKLPEVTEKDILKDSGQITAVEEGKSLETLKPSGLMTLINGIWQKQSFSIADQNKATYCFTNGFDSAAIYYSVKGINNSTIRTPGIFKNLSIFYQEKRMYREAELCEGKSD